MNSTEWDNNVIAQTVHAIWRRELKLGDFSDADDFFDLGGQSLVMTRIQRAIHEELDVAVPMRQLFRKPTVKEISEYIEKVLSAD
jgi:acyl carrier protein